MPFETFWTVLCEGPCGRRLNAGTASAGAPEMFTSRERAQKAAQDAGWWGEVNCGMTIQVLIGCTDCLPQLLKAARTDLARALRLYPLLLNGLSA